MVIECIIEDTLAADIDRCGSDAFIVIGSFRSKSLSPSPQLCTTHA